MRTLSKCPKHFTFILGLLSLSFLSTAQEVGTSPASSPISKVPDILYDPTTYLWILLGSLIIAVFIALSRAVKVLGNVINTRKKSETDHKTIQGISHRDSVWTKLMKMLTRSVPVEYEADVMLDHDYDGIRELDNKLPPWWVFGFYITIIFAFVYLIHYHVSGSGNLQLEEYNNELRVAEAEKENRIKSDANFVTEANVLTLSDPMALNEGQSIYIKNCVACHGNEGQGGVGPNMTDVFWINGGGIKNIFRVIADGVPSKGMISWKSQLSPKQIQSVASYILTIQGTNPPNPKDPQGEKWEESSPDTNIVSVDTLQQVNTNK